MIARVLIYEVVAELPTRSSRDVLHLKYDSSEACGLSGAHACAGFLEPGESHPLIWGC